MRDIFVLCNEHRFRKIWCLLRCEWSSLRWTIARSKKAMRWMRFCPLSFPISRPSLSIFLFPSQAGIELSRKVFIRYDPIIHGAAATTRSSCLSHPPLRASARASLLITGVPTFFFKCTPRCTRSLRRNASTRTRTRARDYHSRSQSPRRRRFAISGLITLPLCRN